MCDNFDKFYDSIVDLRVAWNEINQAFALKNDAYAYLSEGKKDDAEITYKMAEEMRKHATNHYDNYLDNLILKKSR